MVPSDLKDLSGVGGLENLMLTELDISVNFQVSRPYNSTEITLDLKILIFSLWLSDEPF